MIGIGGAVRLRQCSRLVTAAQRLWGVGVGGGVQGDRSSENVQWLRDHLPAIAYIIICAAYS